MARFEYSRWDGTQVGLDFDAADVLGKITDDLLYHGELNQALRRLLQEGFTDRNGERVAGMRELLEKLRRRRQEELRSHDLGGVYDDIAERLREIVDVERTAVDDMAERAQQSGDQRRAEIAEEAAAERRMALDLLPPDLAGRVRALQEHQWTSKEAQQRFEQLLDELRKELLQNQFNQLAGAMSDITPEQLQRTKDMLNGLNQLLEMRAAGEDTEAAFEDFMRQFGDLFPGNPSSLDELLEQMAQQMAAMQGLLNSMNPEQRQQLQGLSEALLQDMDLAWQMNRLGSNLRQAFPGAGWERSYQFEGQDPLGFAGAAEVLNRLGDIDQLENLLSSAPSPGALADVDIDRARELLGDPAAVALDRLAELTKLLEEAGLIQQKEGRLELTARGMRKIGSNALSELFAKLDRNSLGGHQTDESGVGQERTYETKAYEWGDPFNLSIERTVRNALARGGRGTPVHLVPDDFEVERTESLTRTSTVLMLDLSLSMPMRDNFLAAKKVAMALHSLISGQYPRDYLGIVAFSEVARELKPEQLPEVSWDYVYGTNMAHGLMIARKLLANKSGTRQILMITDGEPTAHLRDDGEVFFSYPPAQETVDATLRQVLSCTRDDIKINTFMLDASGYLKDFVEKMTRLNRGRAFFTTPETLGDFVLMDFITQRKVLRRSGR
jgi:uncharacterized protein with von Willebrand factor type A (vWA) domain